jgi:hypothetical protein
MFLMGAGGAIFHFISRRERRKLLLATRPGSIAAIVALTSRSGWGELLLPYDDEDSMTEKLDKLRFGLDARTGAIVAEDAELNRQDEVKLVLLDEASMSRQLSVSPPASDATANSDVPQLYNPYDGKPSPRSEL